VIADRLARRHTTGPGRLRLSLITLAAFGVLLFAFNGNKLLGRVNESVSSIGREYIYTSTIRAIADHPWIGTGLGSFAETFSRYRDARLDTDNFFFDKAHNTYLELALEIGLPAMALLLAILAGIVYVSARGVFVRRRDYVFSAVGLGVTGLVALHSTIDFSLQMPAVAVAYALVLGLAFSQAYSTQEHETDHSGRHATHA
jgi:O-antigen ligase